MPTLNWSAAAIVTLQVMLLAAQAAHAQAGSEGTQTAANETAAAQDVAANNQGSLQEVTVTATKRAESVDNVPLTISALTPASLEEEDLRSAQDISHAVPGLFINSGNSATGETIAIRGVSSGSLFADATTAIYLDDVPLQKRAFAGAGSGSGSPLPQLYDMDRVEVLEGPQGTLYGEGAEGGAIRFVTPTPSLTSYSGTARAELSNTTDGGGVNYEEGAAFGGPIIPDVLGFRASVWGRKDSGYIDHVFLYTDQTLGTDTNSEERWQGRLSVLYSPTDALKVTGAFYIAYDSYADSDSYNEGADGPVVPAFTVPAVPSGSAAHTFGPYSLGPYETIVNCNIGQNYINEISPCYVPSTRVDTLDVASLSIDYDFHSFTLHSATGYATDINSGLTYDGFGDAGSINSGIPLLYNLPEFSSEIPYTNNRNTLTEELRATSTNTGPWAWVGGLFGSRQNIRAYYTDYSTPPDDYNTLVEYVKNNTVENVYGAPVNAAGVISSRAQFVIETEYAAFGELNYSFTNAFKGIAGLRVAHDEYSFNSSIYGPFFGYATPTAVNGGITNGSESANAVLPKAGVQYQLGDGRILYATAAKGERNGGVNTAPFQTKCASTFAADGIKTTPTTFNPDTLWSYELGAKLRVSDRAQINASVFDINWKDVQTTYTLPSPCGFAYTSNAGNAISKGVEVQARAELIRGLSTSLSFSYADAYYTTAVTGPAPTFKPFILRGDTLPVPPVQVDADIHYQLPIYLDHSPYVSADYRYSSPYKTTFGPGTSGYDADTYVASETRFVTARLGAIFSKVDVALFVDNLFNSQDPLTRSGGRSCSNAACTSYTSNDPIYTLSTFRPRTIGLTANYRY